MNILQSIITLIFPMRLKIYLLNIMGHKIGKDCFIGLNIIGKNTKINLKDFSKIKSGNLLLNKSINMAGTSSIGSLNHFSGCFSIYLKDISHIGNRNDFKKHQDEKEETSFFLGFRANLTSYHYLDLGMSIKIEDQSVIGGRGSQFWTHSFIHQDGGNTRKKIKKEIKIGKNVYIGSRSLILPGVVVGDNSVFGAGSTLTRLYEPNKRYVGSSLRELNED